MDVINALPHHDVVYPKILFHLTIEELFRLRQVSKTYDSLVKDYFKTRRSLDLSTLKVTPDVFRILTQDNYVFRSLLLSSGTHWLTDALFTPVVARCKSLTRLDLSYCSQLTNHSLGTIALHCHLLTEICLRKCHWVDPDNFKILVSKNPNLTKVDVSSCWALNDDVIMFCARSCPALSSVNISNIYSITDASLRTLASSCSDLSKLSIKGCWRVSNEGVRAIGEYCKNLVSLQVSECRDVTEASLARLRVRGVSIDVSFTYTSTLHRLEYTFEYVRPYVNLQT